MILEWPPQLGHYRPRDESDDSGVERTWRGAFRGMKGLEYDDLRAKKVCRYLPLCRFKVAGCATSIMRVSNQVGNINQS